MACWTGRVRVALALVLIFGVPCSGAAQTTLLVHVGQTPRALDRAVEEALRDQLGGGVRHVELSLDELALAAGCDLDDASSDLCVRTIASAAGATLIALEHVTRVGSEWHVVLDVRRADGTHLSTLRAGCEDEPSCAEGLRASAGGADRPVEVDEAAGPARASGSTAGELSPHRVAASTTRGAEPQDPRDTGAEGAREGPSLGLFPLVIFGGATLLGLASVIAGGVALEASHDAAVLGVLRSEEQVDRERSLENEANIALAVGIVLASCGAGLAAVGGALSALHTGPTLEVGLGPRGLVVRF